MSAIIERDTSSPATAILIFFLFAVLVLGGTWFAYTNGLMGRSTIIENHKTFVLPSPTPNPTPVIPATPTPAPSPRLMPAMK
jgi:hypothetical protein